LVPKLFRGEMKEKPVEQIASDYIYMELEYVRKRIQELTGRRLIGIPEISRSNELELLYKKEAYYIFQLAKLKGIFNPVVN
jgi:hypothetical protein